MEKNRNNVGVIYDVTYNEDRTIMDMLGPTEHGGVRMRLAMYDDDDKPATWRFATHGVLMELDAMNNVVFDKKVRIHFEGDEVTAIPGIIKRFIS